MIRFTLSENRPSAMGRVHVPEVFERSYEAFETYPHNLVHQAAYPPVLKAYTERLNSAASTLFVGKDAEGDVSFRDLVPEEDIGPDGRGEPSALLFVTLLRRQEFIRQNVFGDERLKAWIGDLSTVDPSSSKLVGDVATKKDPKCRFM